MSHELERLPDPTDLASVQEQMLRDAAINAARMTCAYLPDTGACHNCSEPVTDGLHFCDADCRNDWQLRNPGK